MVDVKIHMLQAFLVRNIYNVFASFLLVTCVGNASVYAEGVTVGDIIEGYKNNASQFYNARVFYITTTILHRPFRITTESGIILSNEDFVQPTYKIDYWTDSDNLFVRGGDESVASSIRGRLVSFDSVLGGSSVNSMSPADFENSYREIPVFTYSGQDKIVRHWLGYDMVERWDMGISKKTTLSIPKAILDSAIPLIQYPDFLFPPFVPFSRDDKERVFLTDVFFDMPLENFRLLGTVMSEGDTYFVLENKNIFEMYSGLSQSVVGTKYEGADIRRCNVFKAWISVNKGCIPVRLEKSSHWSVDGRLVGYKESLDFSSTLNGELLEIHEINEVSPGFFFPVKASLKIYGITENHRETHSSAPRSFVDVLDGLAPTIPIIRIVSREKKWDVVRIIPDVEISEETLKLPFPNGTELYDMRTNKISIVGMTEAEYEQMLRDEEEKNLMFGVVPDSGMNGVLPDPNSKRNLEDYIPRAPRGQRTAFLIIGVNLIILALILRYFLLARKRGKGKGDDIKKLILFAFLLSAPAAHAEEMTNMTVPPCGIASAYGTFANLGLDISLNDIAQRYQHLFPDGDARVMPLSHLQTLIQSFGLHTLTVQGNLAALDSSYLPAILCIVNAHNGKPLPVGHVVLLRGIQGDMATCTDYQIGVETHSVPLDPLQTISGGKMILVSKSPISLPFPWMSVALWLTMFTSALGLVCVVHSWRQSRKELFPALTPVKNALVLFILLLFVGGCGKSDSNTTATELSVSENVPAFSTAPSSKPKTKIINPFKLVIPEKSPSGSLLLFEKQVQNFGEFQVGRDYFKVGHGGSKVEFEFPFNVGNEDVIIEKVDASCGCVVSDSPVIGQKLSAGSEQNLKFTMDLHGRCGEFISFVNIVTKPEPKEPIMLKMIVFVKQLPDVVPSEIRCRGIAGKKIENVELNVNYKRDESVGKMELDIENSNFGKFKLIHSEPVSEASILQPQEIKDRVLLKLESEEPYTLGQHEDVLTICFKGGFESITVPVKIQIVPPVALAVERLFVGEVKPGEEKTMPVRVTFNDVNQVPKVLILSADENIQARFDEQTTRLHVTVKAPQEAGRFENKMRLTFGAGDSAFDFPISGIVQDK